MPRKPVVRSNEHFYHIFARSNNKDFYELPLEVVWKIITGRLGTLQKKFNLKITAFVLMGNHFHLMMLTPDEDIDWVMFYLMKDTTRAIQRQTGRINKIFGGKYKGCIIENQNYLLSAYKYIYQNPLRAGLSTKAENYKFSTLNPETRIHLPFTLEEILPLSIQSESHILEYRWINEAYSPSENKNMKNALSKTRFSLAKSASIKEHFFF